MFYEVSLNKEQTYWWDEDQYGHATFSAVDDESARQFITTVVQRMNRKYWRMGEPRNITIERIVRLQDCGDSIDRVDVPLWNCLNTLKGFCRIRKALSTFYPKQGKRRFFSIIPGFTEWNPIPKPAH